MLVLLLSLIISHSSLLTAGFSSHSGICSIQKQITAPTGRSTCIHYSLPSENVGADQELSEPIIPTVSSKFFQLEEKEDKETATTELFLGKDGTINFSDTDGPLPTRTTGQWIQTGDEVQIKIKRTFGGGRPGSDMGEFEFDVKRTLSGFLESVGGILTVTGIIHQEDEVRGDVEVGFFSMIDTTTAKLGDAD